MYLLSLDWIQPNVLLKLSKTDQSKHRMDTRGLGNTKIVRRRHIQVHEAASLALIACTCGIVDTEEGDVVDT